MEPQNREEAYLANAAGDEVTLPACPWNRKEAYLEAIGDRINDLDQEVKDLENNPDVVDIVDTYADLEAYDTSTLTDRDIIRVLNDETHDGDSTYYRYSTATGEFTFIGSTGPKWEQSDWAENSSTDPSFVKNRPMYEEKIETAIASGEGFNAGQNPVSGYVWYSQQVLDYALHTNLSDYASGDTVYAEYTYTVDGVEKSGEAQFVYTLENDLGSLDSDMPVGNPWNGAYALENDASTLFRWPVESADDGKTITLTSVTYTKVKKLDAKYIPVDGTSIKVNAEGELEADVQGGPNVVQTTGTSTADVMSQNAVTNMIWGNHESTSSQSSTILIKTYQEDSNPTVIGNNVIHIGRTSNFASLYGISIGPYARTEHANAVAIGSGTDSDYYCANGARDGAVALGWRAQAMGQDSVAFSGGRANRQGEFAVGTQSNRGYNSSNYRLLTGVYDPQTDHDAATKGYVDGLVGNIESALNAINNGGNA